MSQSELIWDDDAVKLLEKIPFFVRKAAKKKIEKTAVEAGEKRITAELMEKIRSERAAS